MWACDIYIDGKLSVNSSKYIIGSIISIGRKPECDISFENDKSVSRNHAELKLNTDGTLSIIDLNSKFSTYVTSLEDGKKVNIKNNSNMTMLHNGDIIQIGACGSKIEIIQISYQFCPTKLNKQEKEQLKLFAKYLKSRVVSSTTQCTHLVASKFAATVKILEGIVTNKPIISLQWLIDTWNNINNNKNNNNSNIVKSENLVDILSIDR